MQDSPPHGGNAPLAGAASLSGAVASNVPWQGMHAGRGDFGQEGRDLAGPAADAVAAPKKDFRALAAGDHCCGIFASPAQESAIVASFIQDGLVAGHKVLYIADRPDQEATLLALSESGIDVPRSCQEGRLEVSAATEVYLPRGRFDPDATLAKLDEAEAAAVQQGYGALRATGEMSWATKDPANAGPLVEYEARLSRRIRGSRLHGICQYDLERFPASLLLEVLATHPLALIGSDLHSNFYYTPPEEFLGPKKSEATLRRWMANLEERTRLEGLREAAAAAQAELEHRKALDTFRRRFLGMASHELRTPMTPIRIQLDLLRRDPSLSAAQRNHVDVLARNTARLDGLVQDLLDLSRLESGRFPLRPGDVDVGQVVQAAAADYAPAAQAKGIALSVRTLPAPAHADGARLQQVVANLVENAVRLTPPGGHVWVEAGPAGGGVRITVRDDGPGLERDQAASLFHPFVRLHDNLEGNQRGSGLGLYIVRTIVEQHGGAVAVRSRGAGTGCTFEVDLPSKPPEQDEGLGSGEPPARAGAANGHGGRLAAGKGAGAG